MEDKDNDDNWVERATNLKITKTLATITCTLGEVEQIAKQAIEDLRINPAPVRVDFKNPFATSAAGGKKIADERTPQMAEYEAKVLKSAWLRLKSLRL